MRWRELLRAEGHLSVLSRETFPKRGHLRWNSKGRTFPEEGTSKVEFLSEGELDVLKNRTKILSIRAR